MAEEENTETALIQRVETLRIDARALENEIRILEGRIKNRSQFNIQAIEKENELNKRKAAETLKVLHALLIDELKPRQLNDFHAWIEVLRKSATSYFVESKANIDLWKNIES